MRVTDKTRTRIGSVNQVTRQSSSNVLIRSVHKVRARSATDTATMLMNETLYLSKCCNKMPRIENHAAKKSSIDRLNDHEKASIDTKLILK